MDSGRTSTSVHYQLRRIIRDCNDKQFLKEKKNPVLFPNFSCHSLRHMFTTRLVEAGVEKHTGRGCMILFLFCRRNLIAYLWIMSL